MTGKASIYRISGFNKETKYIDIVNVMAKSASHAMEIMSTTHKRMFLIQDNPMTHRRMVVLDKKGVE